MKKIYIYLIGIFFFGLLYQISKGWFDSLVHLGLALACTIAIRIIAERFGKP